MTAGTLLLAFRIARRELRGGIRGLRVFLACLVLGVTAIAGLGSLADAVVAGIKADSRELLGGDAEARLAYRRADEAEHAYLAQDGAMSEIASMRAMAPSTSSREETCCPVSADSSSPAVRYAGPS